MKKPESKSKARNENTGELPSKVQRRRSRVDAQSASVQQRAKPADGTRQSSSLFGPQEAENAGPRVPYSEAIAFAFDPYGSSPVQLRGQSQGAANGAQEVAQRGVRAGGGSLPYQQQIQAAFGAHDVSSVRAHVGGQAGEAADELGAVAYATGDDVAFRSQPDLHTAAHEAAHVVQQRAGVRLKDNVGSVGDAYEMHADAVADLVVRGQSAEQLLSQTPSGGAGGTAVQKLEAEESGEADIETLSASDEGKEESNDAAGNTSAAPIQRRSVSAVQLRGGKPKEESVRHKIKVTKDMTVAEFRLAVMQQLFGGPIPDIVWTNSKSEYTVAGNPYWVRVSASLMKRRRGVVNAQKGFEVGSDGAIAGGKERAEAFKASEESTQKRAILDEIDKRYYKAAGLPPDTEIKDGEKGRASLWNGIRDEVLFQHEYIAKLPPDVKKMIRVSVDGKLLTPSDYDQLFRIAKKIEGMTGGKVADYVSRVTGSTTDLDEFERSLTGYFEKMEEREAQSGEREKTETKLVGLEGTYQLYRAYLRQLGLETAAPGVALIQQLAGDDQTADGLREQLDASLKANGFASIADFVRFIAKFESGFKQASSQMVDDLLVCYEARLFKEQQRYKRREGRRLLAHEVAHAAQSSAGAGNSTAGEMSSPGDATEVEADRFAEEFENKTESSESARNENERPIEGKAGGVVHRFPGVVPSEFEKDKRSHVDRNNPKSDKIWTSERGYIKNKTAVPLSSIVKNGKVGGGFANAKAMYVVDQSGTIIVGKRSGMSLPHPTLIGGKNPQVKAAGIVEIRAGKIVSIDNHSGHFRPPRASLGRAAKAFMKLPKTAFKNLRMQSVHPGPDGTERWKKFRSLRLLKLKKLNFGKAIKRIGKRYKHDSKFRRKVRRRGGRGIGVLVTAIVGYFFAKWLGDLAAEQIEHDIDKLRPKVEEGLRQSLEANADAFDALMAGDPSAKVYLNLAFRLRYYGNYDPEVGHELQYIGTSLVTADFSTSSIGNDSSYSHTEHSCSSGKSEFHSLQMSEELMVRDLFDAIDE